MMDNNQFTFRRFIETDAEVIFEEYAKYCWANVQVYISGPCVVREKSVFLDKFQQFSRKQYRPPIIADAENNPFGVYRISYSHANRYHELMLHLWKNTSMTKPVLKQIIDQALPKDRPSEKLLVEVPGYAPELKQAADDLGLELVGTVPSSLRHDQKINHKYIYVTTSARWHGILPS